MDLLDLLKSLGDRLGIIESKAAADPAAPAKIHTRSVTLTELMTTIRADEVRALAELPSELSVPFEKIFEAAGISTPANGWTVERLKTLLQTEALKNLDRESVQKRALGVLENEMVDVEEVVKDAVARDQALDAFEAFARKKMEDRTALRERHIAELDSRILELEGERARLREHARLQAEQWQEWQERKRTQEREMAWAVGHLINRPVISTEGE